MVGHRQTIGSMSDMSGLNWLTGGLGDLVLNVSTGDLGDGVAVLNLDRDELDLGVVNTVLGGDLSAGVLYCGGHRVGNSVGGGQSNGGNSMGERGSSVGKSSGVGESVRGKELCVSFGISLSLSFTLEDSVS